MTKYTVVWHEKAQDELAQLWLDAAGRKAVSAAANQIDQTLSLDAEGKGVPLIGNLRFMAVSPLRVLFHVSEPDRLAKVLLALGA